MKRLTLIAFVLGLAGCGYVDRQCSGITGNASETCVDGVVYLQFTSGAAVKVGRDGLPVSCGAP